MEGPAMDWRNEDHPSDDGSGKVGWIWSKGVCLGKKVLLAGFVVSSAPLVVPPLVVVSTIAVLSAVPYGLFLASYACTEKIMSTLLPIEKDENGFEEYSDEISDAYKQYLDEGEGEFAEYGMEEKGITKLDEEELGMGRTADKVSPDEVDAIVIAVEGKDITARGLEEEEALFEVTNVAVNIYQQPDVPENEELVQETRVLIEKIRDEGKTDEVVDKETRENLSGGPKKQDEEGLRETAETKAGQIPEKKEQAKIGRIEIVGTIPVDEKKAADQRNLVTSEGELKSTSTQTSSGKDVDTASNEVLLDSEEKIWEKIEAVRVIVGYKAARSTTCIEELKALYLFTGVEPPALFKEQSDILEVGEKLRFLMSIVGIK